MAIMVPLTNKCLVNGSNGFCLGSKDKTVVPIPFKAVRVFMEKGNLELSFQE